jgi:protein gp37
MAEDTRIEWADHTFNPWIGCTKVSPACDHCYAEAQAGRYWKGEGLWAGNRKRTSENNWRQPLKWNRQATEFRAKSGRPPMVFCASLGDVFDNQVPDEWRRDLWELIHQTPGLVWLLLTKRPQNIRKMLPNIPGRATFARNCPPWDAGWPNVWLGTTVENQAEADRRIPHLLAAPAAKRFLSCEPLLGPVDLTSLSVVSPGGVEQWNALDRTEAREAASEGAVSGVIDWVIAGGESGREARLTQSDWFRSLRDQCAAAGVPFLFKQWGEWAPGTPPSYDVLWHMQRVGKKAAGRLLDGVIHDARPEAV